MEYSTLFIICTALITVALCATVAYIYEVMKNNVLAKEIQLCENKVKSWEKTLKDREIHFAEISQRSTDIQNSVTKFRIEFDELKSSSREFNSQEFFHAGQKRGEKSTTAQIHQRIRQLSEETEDTLVSNTLRILAILLALESYNTSKVPVNKFVNLTLSSKHERLNDYQVAAILSKFKRSLLKESSEA